MPTRIWPRSTRLGARISQSASFDQEWLKRASQSLQHPLTKALLVLTFTTGLVDAVSYLGLGRVFTANMTGNIVLLGFGIAGSGGLPVLAPLVSLVSFLLGAGAGGVLATRTKARPVGSPRFWRCSPGLSPEHCF